MPRPASPISDGAADPAGQACLPGGAGRLGGPPPAISGQQKGHIRLRHCTAATGRVPLQCGFGATGHGGQHCGREDLSGENSPLPQCCLHSRSRQVRHFVAAVATSTDGVFELALEVVAETPGELGDGFVEAGGRVIALRLWATVMNSLIRLSWFASLLPGS